MGNLSSWGFVSPSVGSYLFAKRFLQKTPHERHPGNEFPFVVELLSDGIGKRAFVAASPQNEWGLR